MMTEPCGWELPTPEDDSACAPCAALDNLTKAERERVESMAIELIWRWTGKRFGICEETVRPCRAECDAYFSTMYGARPPHLPQQGWLPALIGGQWFNIGCGMCSGACSCAPSSALALELPPPVVSITKIKIDGVVLDPAAYSLRDGVLYRTDGGIWPECNSQGGDVDDPESGAWEIIYQRGEPVPVGGLIAAYTLACELAKAMCNDNSCQLPSRVQSVTRQGVSMEITETTFAEMKDGQTGIWIIDSWTSSVNRPPIQRPAVFSPDIEPGRGTGLLSGIGRGRTR